MAIAYSKADQLNHKRKSPKKAARGRFDSKTTQRIFEYDNHLCAYCRSPYIEYVPHHIIYRSQCGEGTFDNGAAVCSPCHKWAHGLRKGVNGEPSTEGRKWFEAYRERKLVGL